MDENRMTRNGRNICIFIVTTGLGDSDFILTSALHRVPPSCFLLHSIFLFCTKMHQVALSWLYFFFFYFWIAPSTTELHWVAQSTTELALFTLDAPSTIELQRVHQAIIHWCFGSTCKEFHQVLMCNTQYHRVAPSTTKLLYTEIFR